MKPILLIFDIDGTLTQTGGLGRMALEKAALELYGVPESTRGIQPHGLTDYLIFLQMLEQCRVEVSDPYVAFQRFCPIYTKFLRDLVFNSDKPRLIEGVWELLQRLQEEDDIYLALGTGNIKEAAYIKLNRHRVGCLFPVGGFGDDDGSRDMLLTQARLSAEGYYRRPFPLADTWVIGDTPRDVIAGKMMGARTLAVATSIFDRAALEAEQPDAVFNNLSDSDRFLALVRGIEYPTA